MSEIKKQPLKVKKIKGTRKNCGPPLKITRNKK